MQIMDNKKESLTREEQLIVLIDRYITDEYKPEYDIFTYKLYLIFVGYHLKYFYTTSHYCFSNNNIENIIQMILSIFKCLESNFIKENQHKKILFLQLNALIYYIERNQVRLEQIYVELKTEYELKEIGSRVSTVSRPKMYKLRTSREYN